jgi:proline iminopeptidase
MFEQLGGPEVREVARRFFENPGPEAMAEYQKRCLPLYNRTPAVPEAIQRAVMNPKLMADFFLHESHTFNFLADLGKIKCPTLITAGELDPILPVADSKDIAAAMTPGVARLEVFENAGHGVHRDQPDRFFKMFNEFILA